jgi:hypothetical protein
VVLTEVVEGKGAASGQQRRDDLEGRVLGGGGYEGDDAGLDWAKECVLLGLGEAVQLVAEDYGLATRQLQVVESLGEDGADLVELCACAVDLDEARARRVCDEACDGGLAGAWVAPEDHGRQSALVYHCAQHASRRNQLLAVDIVERRGAHALGQRHGILKGLELAGPLGGRGGRLGIAIGLLLIGGFFKGAFGAQWRCRRALQPLQCCCRRCRGCRGCRGRRGACGWGKEAVCLGQARRGAGRALIEQIVLAAAVNVLVDTGVLDGVGADGAIHHGRGGRRSSSTRARDQELILGATRR